MENARRQARVDALVAEQLQKILFFARAAAGDDGHADPAGNGIQHLEIKAVPDTVRVNAVEADFTRAVVHGPCDPVQRVPARILAPALGKNAELAVHPLDVCREDDALVAVPLGRRRDEVGVLEGSRVDTDLIGPALEHPVKIFQRVDAAAHGEGDEDFAGHPGQDLREEGAALKTGRDVVKHQLIGPGSVVMEPWILILNLYLGE